MKGITQRTCCNNEFLVVLATLRFWVSFPGKFQHNHCRTNVTSSQMRSKTYEAGLLSGWKCSSLRTQPFNTDLYLYLRGTMVDMKSISTIMTQTKTSTKTCPGTVKTQLFMACPRSSSPDRQGISSISWASCEACSCGTQQRGWWQSGQQLHLSAHPGWRTCGP